MSAVIDAQLAWWPPTLRPSVEGRRWLALWIVQADSQRNRSSRRRSASRSSEVFFSMGRALAPPHRKRQFRAEGSEGSAFHGRKNPGRTFVALVALPPRARRGGGGRRRPPRPRPRRSSRRPAG